MQIAGINQQWYMLLTNIIYRFCLVATLHYNICICNLYFTSYEIFCNYIITLLCTAEEATLKQTTLNQ